MIKCPNCGKQNQEHYKFCLGCGSELPRDASRGPAPTASPTPPSGMPGVGKGAGPAPAPGVPAAQPPAQPPPVAAPPKEEPPAGEPEAAAPAAAPSKEKNPCPSCGSEIPPDFSFCGKCGYKLGDPLPSKPPAPKAEAEPKAEAKPDPEPEPEPAAAAKPEVSVRGKIVMIQPSGAEGTSIPLTEEGTEIGRSAGDAFKDDYFLSPKHAKFTVEGGTLNVEDLGSLNGIFVRLAPETPYDIQSGDLVRIGQEVMRFEVYDEPEKKDTAVYGSPRKETWGRISLLLGQDKLGNAFALDGKETLIGRERGNIIFPDDGYVSGLHLKIIKNGDKYSVTDLKSSNGSYLRIRDKKEVKGGDYLLVGQYLYRVDF